MNDGKEHEHGGAAEGRAGGVGEIAEGISQVVISALGVGAALSRLVARSTARGPLPDVSRASEPVAAMVHYGAVTLKNVVGMVAEGAQFLKVRAGPATPDSGRAPAKSSTSPDSKPAGKPRVHQGGVLRLPLSIENSSSQPLGPILFESRDLQFLGTPGGGTPLAAASLSFVPPELKIQPHDFEKLTVFIDVPSGSTPGLYRALIGSAANDFQTSIDFEVLPD